MDNSKACILDHNSLGELNNAFQYAADSVLKVRKAISDYLKGVVEVMEKQLELVEKEYDKAKDRLELAKARLESARARLESAQQAYESARESMSSSMDGADGAVSTIASAAYGAVSAAATGVAGAAAAAAQADYNMAQRACDKAQRDCDEWKRKYEIAKDVVSDCKKYKSDWEYQDPFVSGGDYHLEMLGTWRTDEATEKLIKILEIVEKYLNVEISSHGHRNTEEVVVLDKYDKRKIIENSNNIVRDEQIHELNRHHAVGATRVAKCKKCGRPLSICICGNSRENIELV